MGIDAEQVAAMSREEKLDALELIWAELVKDDAEIESPAWHEKVLRETEARLAAGEEEFLDWEVAKRQLRNWKA